MMQTASRNFCSLYFSAKAWMVMVEACKSDKRLLILEIKLLILNPRRLKWLRRPKMTPKHQKKR